MARRRTKPFSRTASWSMQTARKFPRANKGRALTTNRRPPKPTSKNYGADVVRLWVASQDYRNDIVVSEERIEESFRNLSRHPQRAALPTLEPLRFRSGAPRRRRQGTDRARPLDSRTSSRSSNAMCSRPTTATSSTSSIKSISQFVAVELSSQYHDLVKDRLYTDPANSPRRRSTQTALCQLVTGLVPIARAHAGIHGG